MTKPRPLELGTKEAEHDAAMLMWLFDAICVASDDPASRQNRPARDFKSATSPRHKDRCADEGF